MDRTMTCPACEKRQLIDRISCYKTVNYIPDISEQYKEALFYDEYDLRYYVMCNYCKHELELWEIGLQYTVTDGWGTLEKR